MTEESKKKGRVIDTPDQLVSYANLCGIFLSTEEACIHFGQRKSDDPGVAEWFCESIYES